MNEQTRTEVNASATLILLLEADESEWLAHLGFFKMCLFWFSYRRRYRPNLSLLKELIRHEIEKKGRISDSSKDSMGCLHKRP